MGSMGHRTVHHTKYLDSLGGEDDGGSGEGVEEHRMSCGDVEGD